MQMDVLRCKTPEMVDKEIWAHLLAYNLLRTVMAVAAAENGIEPREVSFKGAKQAVTAFAPKIEAARPEDRPALIDALLAVDRLPPRRRPPGAVGAAGAEAAAEAGCPPDATTSRGQAAAESLEDGIRAQGSRRGRSARSIAPPLKLAPFVCRTERARNPRRDSTTIAVLNPLQKCHGQLQFGFETRGLTTARIRFTQPFATFSARSYSD